MLELHHGGARLLPQGDKKMSYLIQAESADGSARTLQSQPRRLKYKNGKAAESSIRPSANG